MSNAKVSSDFEKFYGSHAQAIEEAKKAENSMATSPTPVGWKGKCILLEAVANKSKDKPQQDGTIKPGNPYVNLKYGIVNDERYQGKTFTKNYTFSDSKNATAADRFGWFLNTCENLGLPRDIRENHNRLVEVLDWLLASDQVFDCECVASDYTTDKKDMVVRRSEEAVDTSSSMMPTPSAPSQSSPEVGGTVKFLGNDWTVEARDGANLSIVRDDNGEVRRRTVTIEQLS